ncbi:type II toxin-antitoxin system RelB/DinJ family antitoxin [Acinetobacter variabilis]|uniref:type II toxin-antitoxin system RelB/DinJ family antitoxin n=1 Tax=Acinetobacter variabilis TaxID=70346 RepID=UPI0028AF0B98|nr:type II toxin-antitoxin system RelB/DinJ family antitoxin [Acinetobacter variabilis]
MDKDDQQATVNIRVDKKLKEDFDKVIKAQGQSITQAITGLFEVTVKNKTLPFTPVTDYFTPQEYFQTATEKAEELVLILESVIKSDELTPTTAKVALNALEKTAHYINAHLDEINKFEHGLFKSEGMTFYVANLAWADLLREISQAEYNLRAFDAFAARRKDLADNVEKITYRCGVLRRYLAGKQPETVKLSELINPRPLPTQPVSATPAAVSACLEYEAGAATCSLMMDNPEPGDVLEHIGPGMPFRLFIYGPDVAARSLFAQSLMASPLGSTSVLLTGKGPQDAADAWRAYKSGVGAVVDVDAPDYPTMREMLYGSTTPLTEEPAEVNLSATGDAEARAEAVSRTMRQPAKIQIIGESVSKP